MRILGTLDFGTTLEAQADTPGRLSAWKPSPTMGCRPRPGGQPSGPGLYVQKHPAAPARLVGGGPSPQDPSASLEFPKPPSSQNRPIDKGKRTSIQCP